jgi:hypothetical protein
MNFCKQCGSASRDKEGFCGGCGARWEEVIPAGAKLHAVQPTSASLVAALSNKTTSSVLFSTQPKSIWIAILLAVLFGPFGLIYCTTTGAWVTMILSIILGFFLGKYSLFIMLPTCALWAWKAARDSSSAFD